MKNLKVILFIICFLFSSVSAKPQQEENNNDFLYSQEYFDYLIEYASILDFEEKEAAKEEAKRIKHEKKLKEEELAEENKITLENDESDIFKLKIENNDIKAYKESFKKEDTKTTIRISKKLNAIQDTYKFKNKYNSDDYKFKTGIEYSITDKLTFSSGLETNLRGLDQNPISKKVYFTPSVKFNDKFSISFINKMNTLTKSSDHDISFAVSPFKSKSADFNVYAGYTRNNDGSTSESINFSTNIYFF